MLQRAGLAAALVHDPELLDPRRADERARSGRPQGGARSHRRRERAGRTIFFSTHILSDVETLCDRVCILRQGEVVVSGALGKLLDSGTRRSEIHLSRATPALKVALEKLGGVPRIVGENLVVELEGEQAVREAITRALAEGAAIQSMTPKRETLEELFVRRAL